MASSTQMDMNLSTFWETAKNREASCAEAYLQRIGHDSVTQKRLAHVGVEAGCGEIL